MRSYSYLWVFASFVQSSIESLERYSDTEKDPEETPNDSLLSQMSFPSVSRYLDLNSGIHCYVTSLVRNSSYMLLRLPPLAISVSSSLSYCSSSIRRVRRRKCLIEGWLKSTKLNNAYFDKPHPLRAMYRVGNRKFVYKLGDDHSKGFVQLQNVQHPVRVALWAYAGRTPGLTMPGSSKL